MNSSRTSNTLHENQVSFGSSVNGINKDNTHIIRLTEKKTEISSKLIPTVPDRPKSFDRIAAEKALTTMNSSKT